MERIVTLSDGSRILLEGKVIPDAWQVSQKCKNGHSELSFKPLVEWVESDSPAPLPFDEYERRDKQREKNAQRAKAACRWVIKSQGLNEMVTLTYTENQLDRDLCKKHFKEWVRRMKAALGGQFVYCASFERQDRGAMHVHIACHKLPSHGTIKNAKVKTFDLGTRIWRSIVGADNGLCYVGAKGKNGKKRRNLTVSSCRKQPTLNFIISL